MIYKTYIYNIKRDIKSISYTRFYLVLAGQRRRTGRRRSPVRTLPSPPFAHADADMTSIHTRAHTHARRRLRMLPAAPLRCGPGCCSRTRRGTKAAANPRLDSRLNSRLIPASVPALIPALIPA